MKVLDQHKVGSVLEQVKQRLITNEVDGHYVSYGSNHQRQVKMRVLDLCTLAPSSN